ncbi:type IV toxin-antitoxin system AbiEi family antitoxin domain-containing protein [Nocardioides sp. AE5]|uniref:type IV toxin-antitoxin system AbiEi family antitoxin domain-containing protein n=1 Tax=Nocardioides sp. AE5 TaxID=2962573 RepID=UPI002880E233|nr:type IV toxin-antitoxin system AbiEi family antitoxin domain-containing protein [Nocardioides sp. AE5]MDT0201726.1 type IV toxin-antitoxin system AbiEi family antitoxin domain-containing protein [Nocardioides sp. AE5]
MSDSTVSRIGILAERRWGMFTTAQAEAVGVSRKQLVRMTASGVLERLAQGVYRMAGAPPQDHENIYATWLALGGATSQPTKAGTPALVAAGVTAAVVHEIGDFFLDGIDFIVGSRKTTRLPDVRLRIRRLTPADTISVNGLPTLTVERTITDLLDLGTDTSLIDDALREAARFGKITDPQRLRADLTAAPTRLRDDAGVLIESLDAILAPNAEAALHG